MKIMFLDIDGVLVTAGSLNERLSMSKVANEECINNLNLILDQTNAKIVISSAWRFNGLNEMRTVLKFWGIRGEVIGATPDLTHWQDGKFISQPRILEIEHCLREIIDSGTIVDSYVILDDIGIKPMNSRHVLTDFNQGLSYQNALSAIEILNISL